MRLKVLFVLCAALALTVGVATATAGNGGNSANAKLCQKDGWQTLYTSSGATFANQDDCVSYGAEGGTLLTSPPTQSQIAQFDCENAGGTFTEPAVGGGHWTCGPLAYDAGLFSTLGVDCFNFDSAATLYYYPATELYLCD